jgi:nucleotide-binding universal stress UspA family protein
MNLAAPNLVLVPFDLSGPSFASVDTALGVAPPERVHVVHVVPVAGALTWAVTTGHHADPRVTAAEARVRQALAGHGLDSGRFTVHIRVGAPGPEICELAERLGADLVIIGAHGSGAHASGAGGGRGVGEGALTRLLYGSVTADVAKNATRPVLVMRGR